MGLGCPCQLLTCSACRNLVRNKHCADAATSSRGVLSTVQHTTHAAARASLAEKVSHSSRYGQLPSSSCRMSRYSSVRPWLRLTQMGWLRSLLKQAAGRTGELGHRVQQAGRCGSGSSKAERCLLPGKHAACSQLGQTASCYHSKHTAGTDPLCRHSTKRWHTHMPCCGGRGCAA